ncbi:MAG: AAA family ATPase [Woeseiaceae bacterium]
MELKKVQITNFRSVEDSGEFELDHITCLVGKNEAGKTAILQALAALNPHPASPMELDKIRDYPRRFLTLYDERHSDEDAVAVKTVWEITKEEVQTLEDLFGEGIVQDRLVTIQRRYEAKDVEWTMSMNWQKAINQFIAEANFSAPQKSQVGSPKNTQELRAALNGIAQPTEKHKALLARIDGLVGKSVHDHIRHVLRQGLPKFMYFSNYDRMSGAVRLDQLKAHYDDNSLFEDDDLRGDRLFYEFLEYAGVDLDEILNAQNYEPFTAKLQAASNALTDQILEYWSQNPYIEVRVAVDAAKSGDKPPFHQGVVARARIYNSLHRKRRAVLGEKRGVHLVLLVLDKVRPDPRGHPDDSVAGRARFISSRESPR